MSTIRTGLSSSMKSSRHSGSKVTWLRSSPSMYRLMRNLRDGLLQSRRSGGVFTQPLRVRPLDPLASGVDLAESASARRASAVPRTSVTRAVASLFGRPTASWPKPQAQQSAAIGRNRCSCDHQRCTRLPVSRHRPTGSRSPRGAKSQACLARFKSPFQ